VDLFVFVIALACSLAAYLVEKRCWKTIVRTTDEAVFRRWCSYLEEIEAPYRTKKYVTLEGDSLKRVYKCKVLVREASKVKAPF
jgi:hypothetical protein